MATGAYALIDVNNNNRKRIILDGSAWTRSDDPYVDILTSIGAPGWHGHSVAALIDSMVIGGINRIDPPIIFEIHNLREASARVVDELRLIALALNESAIKGGAKSIEFIFVP